MFRTVVGAGTMIGAFEDLDMAIVDAKQHLEDDPELGTVEVYEDGRVVGQARHMLDSDFQSVVTWLWAGERILPPAGYSEEEVTRRFNRLRDEHRGGKPWPEEGYDLDDPKHPTYYERMVGDV